MSPYLARTYGTIKCLRDASGLCLQQSSNLPDEGPMAHNPNLYDLAHHGVFHSSLAGCSNRYLELVAGSIPIGDSGFLFLQSGIMFKVDEIIREEVAF